MFSLAQLAELVKAELIGDPQAVVCRARPLDIAGEGDVSFAGDPSHRARVADSQATAVIVAPPPEFPSKNMLVVANPKLAFARALLALHTSAPRRSQVSGDLAVGDGTSLGLELTIYPRVTIGKECAIGDRVTLYPGAVIGDRCRIGDDSTIYANVSIYHDCEIGSRVIIHAGTVIGADGFGFVSDEQGHQVKVLQLGRVRIEDDCEIGANCAIDRGGFDDTVLKRGVKLDNFVQVGHNCEVGEDTVVAALTGFSGGTKVGRRCVVAGQVGTNQHITIGDDAIITARSGVTKSVKPGSVIGGTIPARDYNAWRRAQAFYSRLPELAERLKRIERIVLPMERDAKGEP